MKRCLSVLGSTGSIGTQTLDVAGRLGVKVCALAAGKNVRLLEEQIRRFRPSVAAVYDPDAAKALKISVADLPVRVVQGMEGLCEAASLPEADLVCNSVVGMVGLRPTLAAVAAKKDVALANKETLVAGGALVMRAARENGVRIFPVDSEHSAVFQCLQGCPGKKALKRIILTASGGPFFGMTARELQSVTPEQALRHPTWHMGRKVTVDSATMMNKGLEIIEASWLFGLPSSRIDVLVQRESVIHSMVEYLDNSIIAQLGVPDMRLPIQYAITWPQRLPSPVQPLDLAKYGSLTFARPDAETFRCFGACRRALERGGLAPAAANGANEAAVPLFLNRGIAFPQIGELVWKAVENQPDVQGGFSVEDILDADARARRFVLRSAGAQ
ncbi:MAG TPA: 1-deoxy-D-xylulose-5-phosphate reductoisomerase [Ruminococcaceae bacterium]|jgi:1-deoxy-D-xylulose-5-phosphate reductoisomerase|nr:1-deoxy-D-xylulose-5-phosphate reductoisomerase [Oscillospiraceae bacterium]HBG55589.1 1-deoxy-D-xylulose-5-phosphate reductoisomerase [Oscillospiraceae bacterium]HBQ47043.1 1-deoxy-D-xylulose-5-phosphate reductoisomerase [Oscillospiraceae bacterium]HBT91556.1 1-deoxy-D-xylulose-5-phosphate reductoisomerase [Oscillospiraceae bacterium]HCB91233.1 1-deoxy-D-xylulose-5-phosphate reductoisomerase [Oscillospiraceae bacterium]